MIKEKACKNCGRVVKNNICPICKNTKLTRNWKGSVIIIQTDSEIAKDMGITEPGKYALEVK